MTGPIAAQMTPGQLPKLFRDHLGDADSQKVFFVANRMRGIPPELFTVPLVDIFRNGFADVSHIKDRPWGFLDKKRLQSSDAQTYHS